jgi:hypothetical protein
MTKLSELQFAPELDQPVRYIERTRSYYLGLGYETPYVWAHYIGVPFMPLQKPLNQSTLGLVTTSVPFDASKGPQGPSAPYNALAKFYEPYIRSIDEDADLRIAHVGIDRQNANMQDSNCWFPLAAAKRAAANGRIQSLAKHFYGLPTNRSQRHTLEIDAPLILNKLRDDHVDVAVLIPNCPICHQSQSLLARFLEEAGIPTVIMGAAKDIVEHCGVPRAMFSDFPLGNAAGKPKDPASQAATLDLALRTLESAPAARTTVQSPQRWSESHVWKRDYSNVECVSPEELTRLRAANDRAKEAAKALRDNQLT